VAWIAAGLSAAAWSELALAHAKLVGSDPAVGVTISSPKNVHLEFNEPLAAKFSSFRVTGTDGKVVAMTSRKAPDDKSIDAMPASKLRPGLYTVSWTAVSTSDGPKSSGRFSFTVR